MKKKIKVAMVTNHFENTGISAVMLNYCEMLDKDKFELTILAGSPVSEENRRKCGLYRAKMIELPSRKEDSWAHYFQLWKELRSGDYDIVHVHGSSSMMAIELTLARLAGVKKCIAHSHNSECPNMKVHKLLNPYFRKVYTKALACGELAGEWLFGKDQFEILPNGFHTERFRFDGNVRQETRKALGIQDKKVIGHIGRFNPQKNQPYLLKVFEEICRTCSDTVLLLIGIGPDFEKTKAMVEQHPYRERIILYGGTSDTPAMYSAMDVFLLPSRYEGLPVVLLEAQISGLPCIVSDKVTKEVDFGDIVWRSIEATPGDWAEAYANVTISSEMDRMRYIDTHRNQIGRYHIEETVKQLEAIYQEVYTGK